jgi:epoxyqueuosine reductase
MNCQLIKEYIEQMYPCQVGFVKARIYDELKPRLILSKELNYDSGLVKDDIDDRINPFKLMNDVKTIIVVILPYTHKNEQLKDKLYVVSRSSWGLDYHIVVKNKLSLVSNFLKSNYDANSLILSDNHPLHDRHLAYLAGLGQFGKNSLLINEKYGSFFFISLILTNLELDAKDYNKCSFIDVCKDCNRCIKACPTNAITEDRMINSKKCMSYLTQTKEEIPEEYLSKFNKFSFGCDFCQLACVYNNTLDVDVFEEFIPSEKEIITVEKLIHLTNKQFNEEYKTLTASFRGKNVLLRNAIIISANTNNKEDLKNLDQINDCGNLYLKQAIKYAKAMINKGD